MKKDKQEVEFIKALGFAREENYEKAIISLESIVNQVEEPLKLLDSMESIFYSAVDLLATLYSTIGRHKDSADMNLILIHKLLETHTRKHGNVLSKDKVEVDEEARDKLVSVYLNLGASLSRAKEYMEARKYLEQGYFFSYTFFGDEDERTLKIVYNLASNEMLGIDYVEGVRQMKYVYEDMKNYLGENNQYTIRIKNILHQMDEDKD